MKYGFLNGTDVRVSRICLGTMTWGSQNSEAEAHEQMDYALDQGVNFFDTAEMYPVTPWRPETKGLTELYIGNWFKARGNRDKVVLATKVAGPARLGREANTAPRFSRANIVSALEGSLKKLQTDYVDLYQIHWPDRTAPIFGDRGVTRLDDVDTTPIADQLQVYGDLVRQGKIRHLGLSNETPWGVMTFLQLAKALNLPRVATIQNAYNLLNRVYEIGLSEISLRENVGLLAYSPLGGGWLSGKYLDGQMPAGSRRTVASQFTRYTTPSQEPATARYVALARQHGLDPAELALAFVNEQPFVTSNIIGATSMAQLKTDIGSIDIDLTDEIRAAIRDIHHTYPDPCP